MKKITIDLTFLAACGINAKNSVADSYHYTPYIGAGYQFNKTQLKQFRPEYQSGGFYIGSDYSKYFGTEMFVNQSGSKNNGQGEKLKSSHRSYGLDLLGYLPLGCAQKFSVAATVGVGEYVYKLKEGGLKHYNEHGWGYRFGGGVKYAFDSHWQTRFMTRYVKFNHLDNVNQAMEYALSVEYHF